MVRSTEAVAPKAVILAGLSGLLLAASSSGADFDKHTDWSAAALTGDIFRLRGEVLSSMGVPLSVWSSGPGMLFALGKLGLDDLVHLRQGAHLIGWLAGLAFWWAVLRILDQAAGGNQRLVLFGAAACFVGTHAGYYSHTHTSETLSLALVALQVLFFLSVRDPQLLECIALGATTALLLVVRPHLVLYGIPTVAVMSRRLISAHRSRFWKGLALSLVLLPVLLATVQIAVNNRWMTGSLSHPSYVFGAGHFQSFDPTQPEVRAVLAHPWHGLFPYHPLYGICLFALLSRLWSRTSQVEKLLYVVILLVLTVHVYIQASWYFWWLGTDTFGMRGLSSAAVVLLPLLIRTMAAGPDARWSANWMWIALTLAACIWSYLLLLRGATNLYSYDGLWDMQMQTVEAVTSRNFLLILFVSFVVALQLIPRPWTLFVSRNLLDLGTLLLTTMAVSYLLTRAIPTLARHVPLSLGIIAAAWLAIEIAQTAFGSAARLWIRSLPGDRLASWAVTTAFVASVTLFGRLAVHTEIQLASAAAPKREFRYVSSIPLLEVRESYREYLWVQGFETKKAALRELLQVHGLEP